MPDLISPDSIKLPAPVDVLGPEAIFNELEERFPREEVYGPCTSYERIMYMEGQQSIIRWLKNRLQDNNNGYG
jgi:hypothetical protein